MLVKDEVFNLPLAGRLLFPRRIDGKDLSWLQLQLAVNCSVICFTRLCSFLVAIDSKKGLFIIKNPSYRNGVKVIFCYMLLLIPLVEQSNAL